MKPPFPPRCFVTSVLLSALVALFVVSVARRTQRELSSQLAEEGLALAEALETSSRNAILSNALMEEVLAQANGAQTRAAELLGISERVRRYKLKKYGLSGAD